jgi:large subunit ribosomal protein L32
MPNPKRRMSTSRRDKRRAQFNARTTPSQTTTDPVTGEVHLTHRAYWLEGKLYYKGRVLIDKSKKAKA